MLRSQDAYHNKISEPYDRLVSCEDLEGNIPAALLEIADIQNKVIVDLGAGTGRLSGIVAPHAAKVIAVDFASEMLRKAADNLIRLDQNNWTTLVSDMRSLPIEDNSVDVVVAGWSICYLASSDNEDWKENLAQVMNEVTRILKNNGTFIIFETLGTGNEEPIVYDFLKLYFDSLASTYGFEHKFIRTDYQFDSVEEAEAIMNQFFGEELSSQVKVNQSPIVPECTGVWWKTICK